MVEFALVSPILFFLIFGAIDSARAIYYYTTIAAAANEAAREITLPSEYNSDCKALSEVTSLPAATIQPDPKSWYGPPAGTQNMNPTTFGFTPSTPPANTEYMYLWPAEASASMTPSNWQTRCWNTGLTGRNNTDPTKSYPVVVQIRYSFVPWTPIVRSAVASTVLVATSYGTTEVVYGTG
jgi:Flp pilus assembly protein TadG